ncbi:MAG: hypothetical protein M0D57_20640 [Sphingobacteriales bacterium JAD_PAG50586_3]|nr:MAG: hypothetical protein M0D57_20640 [Sphingobacteriales bacterium JAD_PAG50586_3]
MIIFVEEHTDMITREQAQKLINEMPEKFEGDELIEKIIFWEGVNKGINDVKEGKVISLEELKLQHQ